MSYRQPALLVIALWFLTGPGLLQANDAKIKNLVQQGLVTKAQIQLLTQDDIPENWKSSKRAEETSQYYEVTYYRGKRKKLHLVWGKDWTGKRDKMFMATIYDGETRISSFTHIGESTGVMPVKDNSGYSQIVSVKDDGKMSILITNEKGYCESIVIDGRNSRLMDDLEYTKMALTMTDIVNPLMDAIKEGIKAPSGASK